MIAPAAIVVSGLQETNKPSGFIPQEGHLIRFVKLLPIARSANILLIVGSSARELSHGSNVEIVVGILHCSRYAPREGPGTVRVEVILWYEAEFFPASQSASPFYSPVERFFLGVRYHGFVPCFPIHIISNSFQPRIDQQGVSIRSPLREAFAERHSTVRQFPLEPVNIDEAAHHQCLRLRIKQCQKLVNAAIRIPNTIVRVIVGFLALPKRVLSCIVLRRDHRSVYTAPESLEQVLIDPSRIDFYHAKLLFPRSLSSDQGLLEVEIWNLCLGISTRLSNAHEAHTHTNRDLISRWCVESCVSTTTQDWRCVPVDAIRDDSH